MPKIGAFFGQIKTEMKKVAWPSRYELTTSTVVVIISTFLLAIYVGICDVIFQYLVNILIRGAVR